MTRYCPSDNMVFSGPTSLVDYFNPDKNPPLPLVELPPSLNPFVEDGVRIYAKMLTALPATNVKCLPALNLLEKGGVISLDGSTVAGNPQPIHQVTESSSGSTVTSMAMIARQHGVRSVKAWMSNKVSPTKARLMRFFGLELSLFGGPSQSSPQDPMGGISKAAADGRKQGVFNPNQYENLANPESHERWTAKQLLQQLPGIDIFCAGMGTGGTITGTGKGLKSERPGMHVIGVCVARGDKVPGPRPRELLEPVDFEWKSVVDSVEDVSSLDSYRLSMEMCRWGIVSGPSSGFSLQGLFQVLERRKREGTLDELRGSKGKPIEAVFLCCDLPFQYLDEYFDKLPESSFPPIHNENLFNVDQYGYSTTWILDPSSARTMMVYPRNPAFGLSAPECDISRRPLIFDLRSRTEFAEAHLAHACSTPLSSLQKDDPSPYEDAVLLATQWTELKARFLPEAGPVKHTCSDTGPLVETLPVAEMVSCLRQSGREALVIDYDGETAKVAVSVLRKAGVKAFSVRGGMKAMKMEGAPLEHGSAVQI
ncbi:tryptophan synthase beta subunit-like PLP-dependent enzyme [Violaceomyces palustris]|uniref:Tryptophan synthase beta subunit-like PLP-dependent enzyme n=1 Tax=Violaceomyces palustris TaxID=1673888 RepID=A0ACD0P6V8_9BASI|nr:tryptophan synthase beta subunit-like PLP-dependent enzyme [Violaceomyces palustris]